MIDKLLTVIVAIFIAKSSSLDPEVTLKNGKVLGNIQKAHNNQNFMAFEGIPYAKPPIGDLRFEEPKPADPWDGTITANNLYTCVQYLPLPGTKDLIQGTEDCLYMNVYVPGEEIDPDAKIEVVVHIHGGAFVLGSPKLMAAPLYIMTKNVIYVTFNYRLAILGFLSTQDDIVPGNNGLKDQILALRWIQDNIEAFGGNPNSITLTGLSAGSASVHYHYLSPKSKGLFHRGICMSGSVLNPWSLTENPLDKAKKLGEVMNCPTSTNKEMVDCLKSKNGRDLGLAIKSFFSFANILPATPFGPVIENGTDSFISEHPYKMLLDGRLSNDVPLIMSCVKDEGIYPVGVFRLFGIYDEVVNKWNQVIPASLDILDTVNESRFDEVSEKVKEYYFKGEKIDTTKEFTMVKMFSDRYFYNGIEMSARMHAKVSKSNVYFYYFSYVPQQFEIFPTKGVAHSYDSKMIFKLVTCPKQLKPSDNSMMNFLGDLIYNYGKENKPILPSGDWNPINKDNSKLDYLHIYSGEKYEMESVDELSPTAFWKSLDIKENDLLF